MTVVGAALVGMTPPADAQTRIQVRARAFLDGLQASSRGAQVTVSGALRDNLGAPVPGVEITISSADAQRARAERTDADGRFRATLQLDGEGERTIQVRWAGHAYLDPVQASVPVTIGRNPINLRIDAPDEVEIGAPAGVRVVALDGRDVGVPRLNLQIELDGEPLRSARTDRNGRAAFPLPPLVVGDHQVKAIWPGDGVYLPAEAEWTIEASRPMGISLSLVGTTPPKPGDKVVLDAQVDPAPDGARVSLTANGRPIDDGIARGGGYRFVVDPDDVEPGPTTFRALVHSEEPGWRDARSEPLLVEVPPPPPPSPWWIRAPLLLAALSLIGLLVHLRRHPTRERPAPPAEPARPPPFTFEALGADAPADRLEIEVRDALSGDPLAARLVRLPADAPTPPPAEASPPPGQSVETDSTGRAELTGAGDRLWCHAPGYAPSCHALPRAGGRAIIHLLPLRAELQVVYSAVLATAGRPPLRFGKHTPREAVEPLALRGAPGADLDALTALIESACYGEEPPTIAHLAEAHRLAEAVRGGLGTRR